MLTRLRAVRADREAGFTLADVIVGSTLAGIAGAIGLTVFVVVTQQTAETTTREDLGANARTALAQMASEIQLADSPAAVPVTPEGRFDTFLPDKVVFYSNRDGATRSGSLSRTPPSKVSIERVADATTPGKSKLVLTVWNATVKYGTSGNPYPNPYNYAGNYPTTPTQTLTLAQGIGNKSYEALFTYCSALPDPEPSTTAPTSTPTPGATPPAECDRLVPTGVAATDRVLASRISSVIIRLKVGGETYNNDATGYQPATWLTTRVAIAGKVLSDPPVSAP